MAEKCGSFAQLPDALHAESFVSGVIGQFQHRMPDTAVLSDVLLDFVDVLERTGGPEQYALLRALAAIGPAMIAAAARAAADRVPAGADWRLPAWLPSVGQVTPGTCRRWTDRFGEVEYLLVTYRYDEDGPEHALYVTRDHSWHGALWSSALVTEDRLDEVCEELGRQARKEGVALEVIPAREAHDALRDAALAFLEHRHGPPETGDGWPDRDFFETLTLTVQRGAALRADAAPDVLAAGTLAAHRSSALSWRAQDAEELHAQFLASPEGARLTTHAARILPLNLMRLSADFMGRDPRRIGPRALDRLLGELLPASLFAPDALLKELPAAVEAWFGWLGERHLPAGERKAVARQVRKLAAKLPKRARASHNPARPYIADVEENGHDGDVLQAVLERRSFAVPYPGERLVEPGTPPELVVRLNALRPDVPKDREAIVLCELLARGLDPAEYPYHVHVVEQLWADQPREVWESAQRLRARGLSRERVLELLAGALRPHARELPVGTGGVGFDPKEYLDSLAAL
ncbi:hypothetical protein ACIBJF_50170 [Streptomyces sp. NPDC050743]|uniref:hypothetical protein n=1 Tax=Streptomyces sp. NPDC050743 TaxID=3365634 RepID=UPI003799AFB3